MSRHKHRPPLPPGLKFRAADHTYWLNGWRVPSVTQVLQAEGFYGEYEGWPDDLREWALDRGAKADTACSMIDAGLSLHPSSIDPQIAPYVGAYQRFLDETDFLPEASQEVVLINGRCAGTLDVRGSLPGHPKTIFDRKLTAAPKATALQIGAYDAGLSERHERAALVLKRDGTFKIEWYTDPHDAGVFMCALAIYEWKQKHLKMREAA